MTETTELSRPRGGAPKGNQNAVKHGLRRLSVNELPRELKYVRHRATSLRNMIEAELRDRGGAIDVYQAAVLQTLARHEVRCGLLCHWLRTAPELGIMERAELTRQLGSASSERDKCIKALGLDKPRGESLIEALYVLHPAEPVCEPETQEATTDAAG